MYRTRAVFYEKFYEMERSYYSWSYYRDDEEDNRLYDLYRKNPWIALLAMGSLDHFNCYHNSTTALGHIGAQFLEWCRKNPDQPEFDLQSAKVICEIYNKYTPELTTEMISNYWNRVRPVYLVLYKRFNRDFNSVLRFLKLQFHDNSDLICEVQNNSDPSHPFDMQMLFIQQGREGWNELKTIEEFLDTRGNQKTDLYDVFHPLMENAKKSDLFRKLLYTGKLSKQVALDRKDSWALLQEAKKRDSRDGIHYDFPKGWLDGLKSSPVSFEAKMSLNEEPSLFSAQSLISMRPSLIINGVAVSEAELEDMANQEDGLYFYNGDWVSVNQSEIKRVMNAMKDYNRDDLTLFDAMRLKAGLKVYNPDGYGAAITQDEWLENWFLKMKQPKISRDLKVPETVNATLFDYQQNGYAWLDMMGKIGLGACLADDMGLGKTLQVLTLLDKVREENPEAKSLIVVPASLMMNWVKEASRFTPKLEMCVLHTGGEKKLKEIMEASTAQVMITTYGMARKLEFLKEREWDYLILDEAQAIKNPRVQQTRAVKDIPAKHRLALTGTPIENDLSNLWSIFDFLNKGLLGSFDEFKENIKNLQARDGNYEKLHNLVQPFLLRRLKTDKNILSDLPDKIEKSEYVSLTKRQTALYLREIKNLENILKDKTADRITRSGRVLAALTHFKQICNHPDQFAKKDGYKPSESGKFEVLKDICETIKENHECVLVFTQYKEIIPYLDAYLEKIFGAKGSVIHGSTPVAKRQELVDQFNEQKTYIPYMVLSLKAGGTGLNLTQASHVIHFDRWWNPAVENQATDRAYRIGQQKNVVVHKLISLGTIEEHIDELIESKKELAEQVIGQGADKWITEMDDDELLNLVRLH